MLIEDFGQPNFNSNFGKQITTFPSVQLLPRNVHLISKRTHTDSLNKYAAKQRILTYCHRIHQKAFLHTFLPHNR